VAYTETTPTDKLGAVASNGAGAPKRAKKKSRKLLVVLMAVVLVAAFGADKFLLSKGHKPLHALPGAVVRLPETTLNLSDGQLLQVALAVQLQKGIGGKSGSLPAWEIAKMEDEEITLLSSFSEVTLLSSSGKAKAMSGLLGEFRSVVGPGPVGPGVMDVYYTDFVMQ
jgi:flagellar basal body-associated protein FliL